MNLSKTTASLKLLVAWTLATAGFPGNSTAAPGTTVNVNFALTGAGDEMNGKAFVSGGFQQAPSFYSGTTWNDHVGATRISNPTGTPPTESDFTQVNALDSNGNVTTIGYTTASTTTPFDFEGPYTWLDQPAVRMLNGGVRRVFNSGSGNALHNRLTISGLDPAKVYNIYLASSQNPNVKCSWRIGAGGTDQFILNTTATRTSQTWRPGDNWTVFHAVAPDGSGNIDVRGRGEAGADGGAFSGLTLNGFQILEATGWLNPDKAIYDFGDPANNPGTSSVISDNGIGNAITWNVPFSATLAALSPTFTLADFATCSPVSGSTQNFSGGPVAYTVTAQDGTTKVYSVTAVPAATPSSIADMLTFKWGIYTASITGTNVALSVPPGTDVTALNPTFTVYPGATVSPVSGTTRNFTTPVAYTVTAEDGVATKVYTVSVLNSYNWAVTGGTWSTAANWNPASVPASAFSTSLVFNTGGTYTSTHDLADPFQLSLLTFGGTAQATLAGAGLSFGGASPLVTQSSANAVVIGNPVDLAANTTVATTGNGLLTFSGVISGAGGLTKTGSRILSLTTLNTYDGGTTIAGGTINLGANFINPLGSGTTTVNSGATLGLNRTTLTTPLTLNGGLVTAGNSFTSNVNGPVVLNATSTISITGNLTIAGPISGAGGLTKLGTTTVPITGANSYTGPTTVNAGGLKFKNSFYGNDESKWIPANITVGNGGALILNVGGGGEFTTAQFVTLFGNLVTNVDNNGLKAGALLGLDTNNAGAATVHTISAVLTDSSGPAGGGAVGIKHFGAGTLELTGNSTYSGLSITDNNGTLRVSSLNSVNGGTPLFASSNLGAPTTVANGTIWLGTNTTFQGGNLTYTGSGETTDRVINLGGGGNETYRLNHSGSGLLKFTSVFTMTDVRGPKTIELQGSTVGKGEIASGLPLGQAANPNRLVKTGTGTWTLSGDNLYTGTTLVNGGELALVGGSQSSAITVADGAFLGFTPGSPTTSTKAVTLNANAKVRINGPTTEESYTLLTTTATITVVGALELDPPNADYELVVEGGNVLKLKVKASSDYLAWKTKFPGADLTNPLADFDGDGVNNNNERIFGLNPTLGSSANPISVPLNPTLGTFSFTRRDPDLSNQLFSVWTSTTLLAWSKDEGAILTESAPVDEIETVAVQLSPALLTAPRLFVRVRSEIAPPPPPLLSEDFEATNGGFTVVTTGGTPWAHGDPESSSLGGGAVLTGNGPSTKCWGTNLVGPVIAGTDTLLRSPIINLTGIPGGTTLSFALAFDGDLGNTIEVTAVNPTTGAVIAILLPATEDDDIVAAPWKPIVVAIPNLNQPVRLEWRFKAITSDFPVLGAYIDDVMVIRNP